MAGTVEVIHDGPLARVWLDRPEQHKLPDRGGKGRIEIAALRHKAEACPLCDVWMQPQLPVPGLQIP